MTRKILLVTDDDELNKLVVYTALMLTKLNHQVTVETEHELVPAVDKAGVLNIDMVILDLDTKSFNPYAYITLVRTKEGSARKKLLAVTAENSDDARQKAYTAGCDSVMDRKEFQTVISNVLQF